MVNEPYVGEAYDDDEWLESYREKKQSHDDHTILTTTKTWS